MKRYARQAILSALEGQEEVIKAIVFTDGPLFDEAVLFPSSGVDHCYLLPALGEEELKVGCLYNLWELFEHRLLAKLGCDFGPMVPFELLVLGEH